MFKVAYKDVENGSNKVRLIDASFYREEGSYTNFCNQGAFYGSAGVSEPELVKAVRTNAIFSIETHKSKKERRE